MTGACASCRQDREIATRGLCDACRARCRRDHTIGEWGQTRSERAAEFADWRRAGASVASAAVYAGVSERTGYRYEARLAAPALEVPAPGGDTARREAA